ncbi:MAG: M28 family peptidase [Bacteroidota bacterium]|nr:M28 family peptidase [Bacteroidota bacterium]
MKKNIYVLILLAILVTNAFSQTTLLDSLINKVSVDSLRLYIRQLSGDTSCVIGGSPYTIVSRHKLQPGNNKAAQYIYEKFQRFGLTAQYDSFSTTGKNVIGTKVGTHFPNKYYVVCGHFDDMPIETIAPGADDNASGTAGVIELARILSQYNPQYTIKFIGFDEEEQGLVGSIYYATQARNRNDTILGVINLDMIGYDGNNDGKINVHSKNVANTVEIANDFVNNIATYNIGLVPVIVASQPYSDHESFLAKNYGAILVIEDNNDFHPYYHTTSDRFQYINVPYFHKMVKATMATLAKYALNLKIALEHTPIASGNIIDSRTARVNIISGLTIGTGSIQPRLYYRVDYGSGFSAFNYITDIDGPTGFQYEFIIPGQPLGTTVEYYVAAQDQGGQILQTIPAGGSGLNPPGSISPPQFYRYIVANITTAFSESFKTITRWNSVSLWGLTTSSFVSPTSSATDSPSGNYPSNTTNILLLRDSVSLKKAYGATLEYSARWDLENGYDYVQVMISTNLGTSWIPLEGSYTKLGSGSFQPTGQPLYNGSQSAWVTEQISLDPYIENDIKIRFYFRSDASVVADGFYVDDIKITVYNKGVQPVVTSFNTNEGWNLLSLPISLIDQRPSVLFPTATSQTYEFNGSYIIADSIKNGYGYWIKMDSSRSHTFVGSKIDSITFTMRKGWNLIGGLNQNINVSAITTIPAGLLSSQFFAYNGGYSESSILEKGKGYWIKLSANGSIKLESPLATGSNYTNRKSNNRNAIKIIDSKGNSTKLYLTNSFEVDQFIEFPPQAPPGVFDVRFVNDKYVGLLSNVNIININYVDYPLQLIFEGDENINLHLTSDDSKAKLDQYLSVHSPVYINQPLAQVKVRNSGLPAEFVLHQNYPNPFNPKTIIRYQIPEAGKVTLRVYDLLGREVVQLIDEFQVAGYKSVEFDASNFPSGVYFYKLSAGSFTSVKKAILVR